MSKTTIFLKNLHRKPSMFITAIMASILLSGCSYLKPYKAPTVQGNVMTAESVQLLQEGLSQDQVRELLGPPMAANPFNPLHWEYTYYSTEKTEQTKQRTKYLVLSFDNDRFLNSWQQLDQKVKLKEDKSWLGLGWF